MAGITKNPEITPKIKKLVDDTFYDLCKKYKSDILKAGFEMFRNELIFRLHNEKLTFSERRK